MNLIIVESPTKARTLSRFLGKDYTIEATMGHIKDLPKSKLGVDVDNKFKPIYEPVEKKRAVVSKIVKASKKAIGIFIATDPDREGEAIAQHILEAIVNGEKQTKAKLQRISFHEITKEAVEDAISHPGRINTNLVDAQVARRVLDRLVGYKLSPVLWKKIRRGLSAGRVQTVTVRLIVEREREIENFKPVEYWEILVDLKTEKKPERNITLALVKVDGKKAVVANKSESETVVGDLKSAAYKVAEVKKRQLTKNPYPPFTTSTMTQSAARLFYWSAKKTMSTAQRLYEQGLITYHRTDSTNISLKAIEKVREYIKSKYGDPYLPPKPRFYKTKSKVAQEAHEAIRPTAVNNVSSITNGKTRDESRLYGLIWNRFVASQMQSAVYAETTIDVLALAKNGKEYLLRVSGQIMKFDGWRKLFSKDTESILLPEVEKEEKLKLVGVSSNQKFSQPPARFNEATLIKTLEKMGIGRPSTYAPIISTIQLRQYVEKNEGRFTPTPVGLVVNDFLVKYFPKVFEYDFTAKMEDGLDEIANGEVVWTGVIGDFWKPFEKTLISAEKKSQRVQIPTEKLGEKCPECKSGEKVLRIGRFGKFISCSNFPECKYTEKYVEKLNLKCPECKDGDIVVKYTKKRRKFYGCSHYPDCKWASWHKPVQ
jgi:DNA topoisomerase-1